jgi:protein-S-isoprenylcysteine O-methyltransferase Ste14
VVVVLAIAASRAGFLHVQQHPPGIFQTVIGIAMFSLGLALSVWARIHMGRDWGMPMSVKTESVLVTSGPYRRVRHPIYSGILLAGLGTALAVSWVWLFAVVWGGAYFLYSAVIEERNLLVQFPTTYPEYRRTTKMLIPFIL